MRYKRISVALLLTALLAWVFPIAAQADGVMNPIVSVDITEGATADRIAVREMISTVNDTLAAKDLFTSRTDPNIKPSKWDTQYEFFSGYDEDGGTISFQVNITQYRKYVEADRQEIMNIALSAIYSSDISSMNRNRIYNEICRLDEPITKLVRQTSSEVEDDFAGAYTWFRKIAPFISLLFGLFVLLVFVGLGISAILDLAFINIPAFQLIWSSEDKPPKFISKEAIAAVKEQADNVGKEYTNVNWIYLKSRAVYYFVMSLCILYLASGKIFDLVAWVVQYFRGIID